MRTTTRRVLPVAVALTLATGCGVVTDTATETAAEARETVTVTNCGQERDYDAPVERMLVNDGGMIAVALAAGAADQITAVTSMARDVDVLRLAYGDVVDGLNEVSPDQPTLEGIIAARPEVVYAGWNYGFGEARGITPEILSGHGIDTYELSEACRQVDGERSRGTMDPWAALDTDLRNIGTITGHAEEGVSAADETTARLEALRGLPQPTEQPTVFLFDSGTDTVLSSGSFGGPQGIIDVAGARNATEDVSDTWTSVSWERLAVSDPDLIAFVDYPGQSVEEKIATLRAHPASRDLPAVRESRFVTLPYAMWVSSPLNVDAAETLRMALEEYELAPGSEVAPRLDVASLDLTGNDWL